MSVRDSEEISSGERFTQVTGTNRKQNEAEVAAAEVTTEVTREETATDEAGTKATSESRQSHPKTVTAREAEVMGTEAEADLMDHPELEECLLG